MVIVRNALITFVEHQFILIINSFIFMLLDTRHITAQYHKMSSQGI